MDLRIGQGYDIHRLAEGRELWLGGLHIPSPVGLVGHSDADALLHAGIDAVLGALALGDIGGWFPDTDETWRGADSKQLLLRVLKDERVAAWRLVNLDCTIIAERPKLMAYKEAIRASLAALFECDVACVSVKAKTHEKLDSLGAGEALSAIAVVLLEKKSV
ncbi:MAG: 2-C-methyl-D-erythritol 2,4-cyclodiphosphate synthase [Victivallales bacterium]|nr:2-C-methyl-D-erythritol 2,4-cyclodiphosphate synthase [Victivallales bacterium]